MSKNNGFTLVELAISLMVIGLLIGGLLKGQELIENARITRTVKELNDYNTAVLVFRESYGDLPGDTQRPHLLPGCADNPPCNNLVGVGNGRIAEFTNTGDPASAHKSRNFWVHLEKAGLISGTDETQNYEKVAPPNPFNGQYMAVYSATQNPDAVDDRAVNSLLMGEPPSSSYANYHENFFNMQRAAAIDKKMDDGEPLTGMMVVATRVQMPSYSTGKILERCIEDGRYYSNSNNVFSGCLILIRLSGLQ